MKKLKWDIDKLEEAVTDSNSIYEVARKLGLKPWRGNCETIKKWISIKQISTDHFDKTAKWKHLLGWNKIDINTILVNGGKKISATHRDKIKDMLGNVCVECKIPNEWNGKKLTLQLDHINGINTDNRLENLRLLCPNCHSQTSTWCGRKKKY